MLLLGFLLALGAAPETPPKAAPVWDRIPSSRDVKAAYPERARDEGMTARVVMECMTHDSGKLQDCRVISEDPAGWGFGDAMLSLAPKWKVKPKKTDGSPVGGTSLLVSLQWSL